MGPVPERGLLYIQHRGFDPNFVVREYGIQWDGQRLCWPTGGGWARRAITEWAEPKVKTTGLGGQEGAVIGIERLARNPGATAVITEGDFKAASIPLPWIGLGIMGHVLHSAQADRILSITSDLVFFEDHDWHINRQRNWPVCKSPFGGPDDIPMKERMRLLLHAE